MIANNDAWETMMPKYMKIYHNVRLLCMHANINEYNCKLQEKWVSGMCEASQTRKQH